MTSTQLPTQTHPIAAFGTRLHEVLDTLGDVPAWTMTPAEQRDALVALARAESRLAELRLRVIAAADRSDVAAETAATSTGAWLAHATRRSRTLAMTDVRLALRLETERSRTREALADGSVDTDQARVIVRAVDGLPATVDTAERERAEKHLVHLAGAHDAVTLARLARRLHEVVDPDAADEDEGRRLEAEERAAARTTYLHLTDNGDGTHAGRFRIPTLHAAMLRKALHALAAPTHVTPEERARTSRPELMGEAFCRLLERLPADGLPRAGGVSATVVVLLDYDKLLTGLGAAQLDTGEEVSAGLARRLLCEAGVVPAVYRRVLGGPSVVLDVGRKARFHTEPQRIAMALRDGGCTAEGCDRPPGWAEAHHDAVSWSDGGSTSVDNGRLLCRFHHTRAHSSAYETTRLPNGKIRFHRRT